MKRLHAILLTAAALPAAILPAVAGSQPAAAAGPCVVTAKSGPNSNCGPFDSTKITLSNGYNTYVGQDGWACGSNGSDCGPQTLTAYSPSRWSVTSRQRARNTGVLTYPDVQQLVAKSNGDSRPLSSFSKVRSYFAESMPHNKGTIAEAGYDIWLDHTTGSNEVMVWVDNVNRGTGGSQVMRHAVFEGVHYTLLRYGGPGGELIWSRNGNEQRGSVPILAMLRWLVHNHFESTTSAIGQIDFGWEICSTGGASETFRVNDYTLRTAHS